MRMERARTWMAALVFACLTVIAALCSAGTAFAAEGDRVTVDNGIPVVYLNIDESQGTIEQMIDSPRHTAFCYGTVSIEVPEGFRYTDFPDLPCESVTDLAMSIRGRGNSTWQQSPKKPFKIKLDKKTDIFGLGKNKHWVLLANWFDSTLIKDRISGWLGDELGFAFTPRGVPVDVVLTGEEYGSHYLGSYYLSENVRVDENRLEIAELEEGDTDPDIITGGYLIQNGVQVDAGSPDRFYTSRHANWATHTPSFDPEDNAALGDGSAEDEAREGEESFAGAELGDGYVNLAQQQYIRDYIQHFEDVLFEEGTAYRDLMDVDNAALYWLVNIATVNGDGFATGSTYLYKDRDTSDGPAKLLWGPLWDFDFAWGHRIYYTGFEYGHLWSKPMLYDKGEGGFVESVHRQWPAVRDALERMIEDGGLIDRYREETRASAAANAELLHPGQAFDYDAEIDTLKTWIRNRIDWVDAHFSEIDDLIHRVVYIVDGEVFRTDFKSAEESFLEEAEIAPEKEGYIFLGWTDEEGNTIDANRKITQDLTATAQYISEEEATRGEDIAMVKDSDILVYSYYLRGYQIPYEVIPTDAQDKRVTWTSSDEDYATVDENGMISFSGEGQVTVTGTLASGRSRTFTLTVTKEPFGSAEAIFPEQEEIRMTVGQQSACPVRTEPSPVSFTDCFYEPEDQSVVTAGECGVLTAVGPGRTVVHIRAVSRDSAWNEAEIETQVTVIVTEPQPAVYEVTEDTAAEWTRGSGTGLVITVKRDPDDETCFDHFTGVTLDGNVLTADGDYTAVRGSTVVTVSPQTLEALPDGDHDVTVTFDDGEAQLTVGIRTASEDESEGSDESGSADGGETEPSGDDATEPDESGQETEPASEPYESSAPDDGRTAPPGTGDPNHARLWAALAAAAAAAAVTAARRRKI